MIISSNVLNEIIINKSKFITYLYKIKNKDDFINYYNELKIKYKDATHICYAYIIDNEIKLFDDNEPSGTAGMPIYNVLKHIACFVIRYFGGIKLGGSGLIRAYSNSTSLALKKANITKFEKMYKVLITTNYQELNTIENIINKENILDKSFNNNIIYTVIIDNKIKNILDSYNIEYKIIDDNYF